RANRIARLLRGHGVQKGALVGLAMDRGTDMVAALLGILKSGAGYVPLDPGFPADRLAYMAGDAGLAALVTQQAHAARFDLRGRPVLALDALADELEALPATRLGRDAGAADPESPAYVIYTSGSTGRPKGVVVPHRAVSNFIASMQSEPGLDAQDRLLAVTTLSFDIAVLELMLPLSVGGEIVLAGRESAIDGLALVDLLREAGITAMQATPATWRLLLEAGWQGSAGFKAMCGGEPLPPDLAQALLARCGELWNLYGPTETTVWSTATCVQPAAAGALPDIHIGRPIANTQVWILVEQGHPCPLGVSGEICIGGVGVILGYLAHPQLLAERFLHDALAVARRGFVPGLARPPAPGRPARAVGAARLPGQGARLPHRTGRDREPAARPPGRGAGGGDGARGPAGRRAPGGPCRAGIGAWGVRRRSGRAPQGKPARLHGAATLRAPGRDPAA